MFRLVATAVLQVNQNVYVHFDDSEQSASTFGVVTRLTNQDVVIRFPDVHELPPGATVGKNAVLKIANNCGVQCATCAILEVAETPTVQIKLVAPQSFKVIQSRRFFRLQCFKKAAVTVKISANPVLIEKTDTNAITEDISAGGVRVDSILPMEVGDDVVVAVRLPIRPSEDAEFNCPGTVRRVSKNPDNPKHPHQAGIEFKLTNRREEEALMAAMFELQRRKKH